MKQSELVRDLAISLYKQTPERIVYRKDSNKKQLDIASFRIQTTILRWLIDNNVVMVDMKE